MIGTVPETLPEAPWDPRLTIEERIGLTFVGRRLEDGTAVVYEYRNGRNMGVIQPSPLARRKAPSGFEWGYLGPGALGLAHTILWTVLRRNDAFGADDPEICFQRFGTDVVGRWPMGGFKITQAAVEKWTLVRLGKVLAETLVAGESREG